MDYSKYISMLHNMSDMHKTAVSITNSQYLFDNTTSEVGKVSSALYNLASRIFRGGLPPITIPVILQLF